MKRRAILVLLTLALLCVLAVSVSAAPTDPAELNKVYEEANKIDFSAGTENVTCPYCQEPANWKALPAVTNTAGYELPAGHYYVDADLTANTAHYLIKGITCVHLNGKTITSTHSGATFSAPPNTQLNIMGSGNVSGKGSSSLGVVNLQGGTIRLFGGNYSRTTTSNNTVRVGAANAVFEMYAGTTVSGKASASSAIHNGYSTAVLHMYGGTVDANTGVAVTLNAGQFHQYGDSTIKNARRSNIIIGGGAYTLHDGTITAGNAMISGYAIGGNVLLKSGSFTMEDGTISNGVAYEAGGNVYVTGGTFTMKGGEICGGSLYAANADRIGAAGVYIAGGIFEMQGGSVHSNAAGKVNGGNFYIAGGELKLNTGAPAIQNGTATNGGNIYMTAGAVTLASGTISGGTATTAGGSVYLNGGTLDVTGGEITGGTAPIGGSVYNEAGTLTVAGGTISGGTADTAGGSVYVNTGSLTVNSGFITGGTAPIGGSVYNEAGTLTVAGGTISGGTADTAGGSIYLNGGTLDVTGGTISGGTAPDGGNVYVNGGTLTVDGGTITGGTANGAYNSGRHYINGGGNICVASDDFAKAYIKSGTVSNGIATNNGGGNILCIDKGTLSISGGTISGGKAGSLGGNILNGLSNNITISGGTISGGVSNTLGNKGFYYGDNITCASGTTTITGGTIESKGARDGQGILVAYAGTLILDGNAKVTNKAKTGNIFVSNHLSTKQTPKLKVNSTFEGEAGILWNTDYGYGDIVDSMGLSDGTYAGTVYLEKKDMDYPAVLATADNKLQVAGAKLNDAWCNDNAAAVDAAGVNDVIKLYTTDALNLKGATYVVDLNGKEVNITGTGNLTCFDTANLDFKTFGTATVDGPTLVNKVSTTQDGIRYYTVSDDNAHSFHALQAKVSSVSIRPSSAGVYYSCTWNCDSELLKMLEKDENTITYGVALRLDVMPTEDFKEDGSTLYTKVEGVFEPNVKRNSVLVDKILKAGEETNQARANRNICAVPYVQVNGETFVGTGVQYSLKTIVKDLLDQEDVYYSTNRVALENFYNTWETDMKDWGLSYIGQNPISDPADDNVLRFFLMGNSYTYYYVEELYALLAEAGYENAEIYNLYHSGSSLVDHVTWWEKDAAEYQLFKTDKTGRHEVEKEKDWTLDEALVTANWDYIGVQPTLTGLNIGYASAIGKSDEKMEEHLTAVFPYAETLMDHLYGYFPKATFLWQRSWGPEIDRISGNTKYTKESRDNYSKGLQRIQDYMTNVWDLDKPYDLIQVNCGAAWEEARALNDALETKLIPEKGGLCARLGAGNPNTYQPEGFEVVAGDDSGDGYHEGDIGGGQLLNAYVWYMTIMQTLDSDYDPAEDFKSDYVPVYGGGRFPLGDELVALLKNAAMSVFETAE